MPNNNTIVYTNNKYYQDIADAIREKNGTENTYTPGQMAQAILALEAGEGPAINNQNKTVTPTGIQQSITADSGYTGLGTVTVNAIQTETKSIIENGTYAPTTGKYFSSVTVNIPSVNISQDANGYIVLDDSGNYTPPGEWTTDGIAERTEPNGAITINLATGKTIGRNAFYQTPITELTITNSPYFGYQAFFECKSLTTIHAPNLVGIRGNQYGTQTGVFNGCTALQGVVFPSHGNHVLDSYNFQNCTALTYADFKDMSRLGGADVFSNTGLNVLIIRKTDGVTTLQGINNFNNSPFASNGTGGTLYVPSALVSSYQSAVQWSTLLGYANNSIKAIEGSYYETHYADGTLINAS